MNVTLKTKDCDVEVNDDEALYKFTSRYSNAKKKIECGLFMQKLFRLGRRYL